MTGPSGRSFDATPPCVRARRSCLPTTVSRPLALALLLCAAPGWAASSAAQDQAQRMGWFAGKTPLLLETGQRDPAEPVRAALAERQERLLPGGVFHPRDLQPLQARDRLAASREALAAAPGGRRELHAAAARRSLPPRLRAAAASALAVLQDDLAAASLAMVLPDQEDPQVQQLLLAELVRATRRIAGRPGLGPMEQQLVAFCRSIGGLLTCEPGPTWEQFDRLLAELRAQDAGPTREQAATRLEQTPLPQSCPERYLLGLAELPREGSSERLWRAALQKLELRLGEALLAHEGIPAAGSRTRQAVASLVTRALGSVSDSRALAAAINLAGMLGDPTVSPALQALSQRVRSDQLERMARNAQALLGKAPLPLDALP